MLGLLSGVFSYRPYKLLTVFEKGFTLARSKKGSPQCIFFNVSAFRLLVLEFGYCLMISRLFCFLSFTTSPVSLKDSHIEEVLDPLSCHATPGREGSRITCLRMLALNQS